MESIRSFTAIIERENDGFVALCPELDVASQGNTVEEAKSNLQEAIELFLEHALKGRNYFSFKNRYFHNKCSGSSCVN